MFICSSINYVCFLYFSFLFVLLSWKSGWSESFFFWKSFFLFLLKPCLKGKGECKSQNFETVTGSVENLFLQLQKAFLSFLLTFFLTFFLSYFLSFFLTFFLSYCLSFLLSFFHNFFLLSSLVNYLLSSSFKILT